jgi:hypothetical protein
MSNVNCDQKFQSQNMFPSVNWECQQRTWKILLHRQISTKLLRTKMVQKDRPFPVRVREEVTKRKKMDDAGEPAPEDFEL